LFIPVSSHFFGFLVGEGAMVVYSAQPIKVGAARSCGARPRSSFGRAGWRAGGKVSATATNTVSHAARAEIFTHPVAIRQQQRCAPYAI